MKMHNSLGRVAIRIEDMWKGNIGTLDLCSM